MNDLIQSSFHGAIEPLRAAKMIMPTWGLEAIEIIVAFCALYFICFRFLIKMINTEKAGVPEASPSQASSVTGVFAKGALKK